MSLLLLRMSLLTLLLVVPAVASAQIEGRYTVRPAAPAGAGDEGEATIEPDGVRTRRVTRTRGGQLQFRESGRLIGSVLVLSVDSGGVGMSGALSGGAAAPRALLTLSPMADGVLRGVWWEQGTFRPLRQELWSPLATPAASSVLASAPSLATSTAAPPALGLDVGRPDEAAVQRLLALALSDGVLDEVEANGLAAFVKAADGTNSRVSSALARLADAGAGAGLTREAVAALRAAVGGARPNDVPLENDVYRLVPGQSQFLDDDALYLLADGTVAAETGLRSHSRGYAAKRDGVLFKRHGSWAPAHPATSTTQETDALRSQGPDQALDRAAVIAGVQLGPFTTYAATARSSAYYDPSSNTPFWAGICQGWTHNALDDRLSLLVDPPGAEGARGLWIYGQWISRADLGNAMMGASYSLVFADSVTIDSLLTPEKLIKGLAQHVLRSGIGLRVDIWGDAHNPSGHYDPQVWNQPIVGGSVEVTSLSPAVSGAVLRFAQADPRRRTALPAGATVRWVRARARWGVETGDGWEGDAAFRSSEWNMYLVTAADGLVTHGYMAHVLADAGVVGLPAASTDGLPDYMAIPRHALTDTALSGGTHWLFDPSNHGGVRYRFLVGTVLARGIPEPMRAAFEAEAFAPGADRADLAARYPGIANAYSPQQWARVLEPVLGDAGAFGAQWP